MVLFVRMSSGLGLDQLQRFFQSGDWRSAYDGARVQRGEALARKRLVREVKGGFLESEDFELCATVADGKGEFEEVVVGVWEESGTLMAEGSCTCEFATNCEHAAATLAWVAKGDRLAAAVEGQVASAPDEGRIDAWLTEVAAQAEPKPAIAECLVYWLGPVTGGAEMRILKGLELKAGGLGRPLTKLGANEIKDLAREEDAVLLEELELRAREDEARWRVRGMGWELILKRMAMSGRLLAGEDSRQAMKIGEPRNGRLDWREDGGKRHPAVVTEPASDYGMVAGGIWYVDVERRELGRVVIDEGRDRVRQWIGGPEMDQAEWEKCQDLAQKRAIELPGSHLMAGFGEDLEKSPRASGSARLSLRILTPKPYLDEVHAQAVVRYGEREIPLTAADRRRVQRIETENGERVEIDRDRALEDRGLRELKALGLQMGADRKDPIWLPQVPEDTKDEPEFRQRYWKRFRYELGKLLEDRGWELRYAPGVGHEPLIFRADAWKAEIVEEGRGWFHLSAGFVVDGQEFELQPLLAALLEGQFMELTENLPEGQEFLFFLPDGQAVVLMVGRFRRLLRRFESLLEFRWKPGQSMKVHKTELALVLDDEMEVEASEEAQDFSARVTQLGQIEVPEIAEPSGLQATLRSYQLEGYRWMQYLGLQGLNGVLADDMGLGKTLQTLTHLLMEKESGRHSGLPNLIIAPTSVVHNWQREAVKFTPDLSVLILQGPGRHEQFGEMGKYDLVLTSFALLARDLDVLANQEFHVVVLDEAQHIKNRSAQVSEAARCLNSRQRLCLSGTPVENHLGELWALMDFLNPGLLGSADLFNSHFRSPIEKDGNPARQAELNAKVGPLILRRNKRQVATELPPKTELDHLIELSEGQKELYETVRSTMDKRVRQAIAVSGGGQAQIVFLDALLKLRQICCHPALLDETNPQDSAKFDYFKDLLATLLEEDHRTLVFSQFTSMLAKIEAHLQAEGIPYLILTGETKDRQDLVERFQGGEGMVFLISLKAGGTGLTLTGADTVIHYDPWWNPAAENQATDRAYRIGQEKAVMVHKLICQGTVEQRIQQMQAKKGELAEGILAGSRGSVSEEFMADLLEAADASA